MVRGLDADLHTILMNMMREIEKFYDKKCPYREAILKTSAMFKEKALVYKSMVKGFYAGRQSPRSDRQDLKAREHLLNDEGSLC